MKNKLRNYFESDWFGPASICVLALIGIGSLNSGFLSPLALNALLLAVALNGVIVLSQMVVIGIGQMNLSVGAIGGFAAISFAGLMEVFQIAPVPAAAIAILIGILAGLFNGWLIATTGISAFVITLASLSLFKGINLGITSAQPFYAVPEVVKSFGSDSVLIIVPLLVLPTIVVGVAMWLLLTRIPLGRNILAVGANPSSVVLSGVSLKWTIISAHVISGALAALAGIMAVARLQIGQPTIGDDWLLLSFAAPVIGGAVLAGGHVSVGATLWGVALVAIITQALVLFQIDPYLVQAVLGALILWAVGINRLRETRARRSAGVHA